MDPINSILFVLFGGLTAIALIVVLNLLLPGRMERIREKLDRQLLRSLLVGLGAVILLVGLSLLSFYLLSLPWLHVRDASGTNIGVTSPLPYFLELFLLGLALALVVFGCLGLSAVARSMGRRIGADGPAFRPLVLGALILALACLTPFAGWFLLTPLVLCTGIGATLLALFTRRQGHLDEG